MDDVGAHYAATLGGNEKAALNLKGDSKLAGVGMTMTDVIEDGMAQMSKKFKSMSEQLYLDAEKVKESDRVLCPNLFPNVLHRMRDLSPYL